MTGTGPGKPPRPPVSRRSAPSFGTRERRTELAAAFADQGADYDRLRPGYPDDAIDAMLRRATGAAPSLDRADGPCADATGLRVVDLGAGTGKLAAALAARGAQVLALDPSASMLAAAPAGIATHQATAEQTGLPDASADIVTAAQAWHWFELEAASAEVSRILAPGGILALVWNSLDVQVPWVHRYSRIMHAGDVLREDFSPPMTSGFTLLERSLVRWAQPMATDDLIDLARTRSYVATAAPERREKVLKNLDWYIHEHLGHAPGSVVQLPYRTDVFVYAQVLVEAPGAEGADGLTAGRPARSRGR